MSFLNLDQRLKEYFDAVDPGFGFFPTVKFKRLAEDAILPHKATSGAACFDLYANESLQLTSYRPAGIVGTGIAVELPEGFVGMVCSRSGLAAKQRVFVLNAPGIIDADYRGEIKVILGHIPKDYNWPDLSPIEYSKGDRVAQLMIMPLPAFNVEVVDELSETTRGAAGLGSTGI